MKRTRAAASPSPRRRKKAKAKAFPSYIGFQMSPLQEAFGTGTISMGTSNWTIGVDMAQPRVNKKRKGKGC